MEPRLSGYVTLTLSFEQEGREWVGVCLELGTSTFADTLEKCQEELQELQGLSIIEHRMDEAAQFTLTPTLSLRERGQLTG